MVELAGRFLIALVSLFPLFVDEFSPSRKRARNTG
jgi:hypothetical protein